MGTENGEHTASFANVILITVFRKVLSVIICKIDQIIIENYQ